jgi:hypothetical protein
MKFTLGRRFVRFRPVYREGDRLVPSEGSLCEDLRDRIKRVLAFYEVPFRQDPEGELWIDSNAARDPDLMWNYTTKANDPEWLGHHHLPLTSGSGR